MPYLYVLEPKICGDKGVSEGGILWNRNSNGNEDDKGDDKSDGD